ncbi:MAG TPA: ATP-binding protein [Thermoleophilaceae bacterium]|nr:ATP-binding protein [Thermoleophilaceae bacterium]
MTDTPAGASDAALPTTRGGAPVRRLIPFALGFVALFIGLRLAGEKAGLYSAEAGVVIFGIAFCGVLTLTLLYVGRIADRVEVERGRAERENLAAAPALAERARQLEEANADLAETTARLERSNEELQRFATVASHDLREPLRVVSGFAELLARRHAGELGAEGQRFVEAITGGVARMDEMISDLLAYARAGRADQPLEPVDTGDVVRDALDGLGRAIEEAGAQIEVDPLPMVNGNPAALRQLFQNLIANAIKFVDNSAPRVRIWAAEVPEGWRFSVRDNGIGIEPEQAERIFEMFTRLHGAERYPGTGVGLAVCKRIVDVHGGRIWVEPAPGGGSQFMFTIARAPTPGDS